jgi:hypothetical protein
MLLYFPANSHYQSSQKHKGDEHGSKMYLTDGDLYGDTGAGK